MEIKEDMKIMTKNEAIEHAREVFKGNDRFISYCEVMIASVDNFIGIESTDIQADNWNWEKLLRLTIECENGFKQLYYRKGNKKYSSKNSTSNIHDFNMVSYYRGETERFSWNA